MRIVAFSIAVSTLFSACENRSASSCAEGFERDKGDLCVPVAQNDSVSSADEADGNGPDVAEDPVDDGHAEDAQPGADDWLVAPSLCEAPDGLPADPVLQTRYDTIPGFAHVIDAAYSDEDERFYLAGIPALTGWKVTETGLVETVRYDMGTTDHVTVLGPGRVAVSRRGDSARGGMVEVLAVDEFAELSNIPVDDAAGMHAFEGLLYILAGSGSLYTYDVSDFERPIEVHQLTGLGNPWDLVVSGNHAYVADNTLGLVTLDLSDPRAPVIVGEAVGRGGLQDVVVANGHAYGAAGSRGVEVFSLADPSQPESVSQVKPGGGIISVAWANDVLWTANQVGVAAIDVRDPSAPITMGSKSTESWAMAVATSTEGAFLAGWNEVALYEANLDQTAPDAQPDLSALYYPEGTEEQVVKLYNLGAAPLNIAGLSTDVEGAQIQVDALVVSPGESARIRVQWLGSGSLSGELCIATDDPDAPIQVLQILTSNNDSSVLIGEPAPDFALIGVDGQTHTLSEQLGQPVLLIYFAVW